MGVVRRCALGVTACCLGVVLWWAFGREQGQGPHELVPPVVPAGSGPSLEPRESDSPQAPSPGAQRAKAITLQGRAVDRQTREPVLLGAGGLQLRQGDSPIPGAQTAVQQGAFSIAFDMPRTRGPGALSIAVDGYMPTELRVSVVASADLGVVELDRAVDLEVRVRDDLGQPIAWTKVVLSTGSPYVYLAGVTDAAGLVALGRAPVRQYRLTDLRTYFVLQPADRMIVPTGDAPVDIVVMSRARQRCIRGVVLGPDGNPEPGGQVFALSTSGKFIDAPFGAGSAEVQHNGSFELWESYPSSDEVRMEVGRSEEWDPSKFTPESRTIKRRWDEGTVAFRLSLRRIASSLNIAVTSASGLPVERFGVHVFQGRWNTANGQWLSLDRHLRCEGDHPGGLLRIPELESGSYSVVIVPEDKSLAQSPIVLMDTESGENRVTLPQMTPCNVTFVGLAQEAPPDEVALIVMDRAQGVGWDDAGLVILVSDTRAILDDWQAQHDRLWRILQRTPVQFGSAQIGVCRGPDYGLAVRFGREWQLLPHPIADASAALIGPPLSFRKVDAFF